MDSQKHADAVVCPRKSAKPLPSIAAKKQRRYRLRKQWEATGQAWLYVECRECGKPIKPSYRRGFCSGGQCRRAFFQKVQVPQVIYLDGQAKGISARVLESVGHFPRRISTCRS